MVLPNYELLEIQGAKDQQPNFEMKMQKKSRYKDRRQSAAPDRQESFASSAQELTL